MENLNFYLDTLINSFADNNKDVLTNELFNSRYVRFFKNEDLVLLLKGVLNEHTYKYKVLAYSYNDCTLKYEVEIPKGYFPLYFIRVNNNLGMVCKSNEKNNSNAIECEFDKNTGEIINVRNLLCTEKIFIAEFNCTVKNEFEYPLTNLRMDKENNIVQWNFNSKKVSVCCEQSILEALYSDFQETVLLACENTNREKQVHLYNLDGSYRLKVIIPEGFELLSHPPCFNHSVERYALTLLLFNPQLKTDAMLYMINPDNGDLIYKGITR